MIFSNYGDVVEGMLMRSQPIQGVRDSLKGKGGLFICLSVVCLMLSHPYLRYNMQGIHFVYPKF